jgi:hypothetical protein
MTPEMDDIWWFVRLDDLEKFFALPVLSYRVYDKHSSPNGRDCVVCVVDHGIAGGRKHTLYRETLETFITVPDTEPVKTVGLTDESVSELTGDDSDGEADDEPIDLSELEDDELVKYAKSLGITHAHSMKRETILSRIHDVYMAWEAQSSDQDEATISSEPAD